MVWARSGFGCEAGSCSDGCQHARHLRRSKPIEECNERHRPGKGLRAGNICLGMVTRVEKQKVAYDAQALAQRTVGQRPGIVDAQRREHLSVDLALRWVIDDEENHPSNEECPLLRGRADPKPANASSRRAVLLPGGYENRQATNAAGVAFAPEATLLPSLPPRHWVHRPSARASRRCANLL